MTRPLLARAYGLSRRRRRQLLFLLTVPSMTAIACRAPAERTGATATFATPLGVNALSPYGGFTAQFLVFLPLVRQEPDGSNGPLLARSWERRDDGRTFTVHLDTRVRWHDGTPVTARDVEATLRLLSDPAVGWYAPDAFSFTAHDDSTYTITPHAQQWVGTPEDFWTVYYPHHVIEGLDPAEFTEWEFWQEPVGNGPYRHVRTDPQTVIDLEANPDYAFGTPAIEHVRLRIGGASVAALLAGEVDGVPYVSWLDLKALEDDDRFVSYHSMNYREYNTIVWNHRHPALRDGRVRRALTMAIDRRALHRVLGLPDETPVHDAPPADADIVSGAPPAQIPYDPEGAAALLDAAGWTRRAANAPREREGERLAIELIAADAEGEAAAVFVQAELAKLGVTVDVQTLEPLAAWTRLETGAFESIVFLVLYRLWPSGQDIGALFGAASPIGYAPAEVRALIDEVSTIPGEDRYNDIYRELGAIMERDLPVTMLYPRAWNWTVHRRIQGLENRSVRYDPLWSIERLWIIDERDP